MQPLSVSILDKLGVENTIQYIRFGKVFCAHLNATSGRTPLMHFISWGKTLCQILFKLRRGFCGKERDEDSYDRI
jgi:hypothetical protein